jgi:hypothetical protein
LGSEFPKFLPQTFFRDCFSFAEMPGNLICHLARLSTPPLAPPLRGGEHRIQLQCILRRQATPK